MIFDKEKKEQKVKDNEQIVCAAAAYHMKLTLFVRVMSRQNGSRT